MKTLLNLVWLVFCGWWSALLYVFFAVVCCVLVVTIPFGIACFRIAVYTLWPFGNRIVERPDAGTASGVGNVIWLIFAGIWLTIGHITAGIAFCVSIIGIPFGVAHFKLIPMSLMPLGKEIVPSDTAAAYPHYRW